LLISENHDFQEQQITDLLVSTIYVETTKRSFACFAFLKKKNTPQPGQAKILDDFSKSLIRWNSKLCLLVFESCALGV